MRTVGNRFSIRRPATRCADRHQRGNAMVIALIALTGLITLGSLTVLSVQGGLATSGHDRFQAIALCAAESGASAAVDYLRKTYDGAAKWEAYVRLPTLPTIHPTGIPGNLKQPGDPENLFTETMRAWYDVAILNNPDDAMFATGGDDDGRVIIRSTGYGPNGTVAVVEWEVKAPATVPIGRPCPSYGQRGMAEDGAGRNDCLTNVASGDTATYRPGDVP
jgi:hypothetical protein